MERHRHSPEPALRKVGQVERLLNEGTELTEVLRHLEDLLGQRTELAVPVSTVTTGGPQIPGCRDPL